MGVWSLSSHMSPMSPWILPVLVSYREPQISPGHYLVDAQNKTNENEGENRIVISMVLMEVGYLFATDSFALKCLVHKF